MSNILDKPDLLSNHTAAHHLLVKLNERFKGDKEYYSYYCKVSEKFLLHDRDLKELLGLLCHMRNLECDSVSLSIDDPEVKCIFSVNCGTECNLISEWHREYLSKLQLRSKWSMRKSNFPMNQLLHGCRSVHKLVPLLEVESC